MHLSLEAAGVLLLYDFNVKKENNLWLMLAVVSYAASPVLKKPFILWHVFIHSTRKEKARTLASICVR